MTTGAGRGTAATAWIRNRIRCLGLRLLTRPFSRRSHLSNLQIIQLKNKKINNPTSYIYILIYIHRYICIHLYIWLCNLIENTKQTKKENKWKTNEKPNQHYKYVIVNVELNGILFKRYMNKRKFKNL